MTTGLDGPLRFVSFVYGESEGDLDDPAELYHEASKFYPAFHARQTANGAVLLANLAAQQNARRAVKRHAHLPSITLPSPSFPEASLGTLLAHRRSIREFGAGPITIQELSTLLWAAYGVTGEASDTAIVGEAQRLRTAPSGGGLFPLDLYAVTRRVDGLEPGLYHYDPVDHVLEELRHGDESAALGRGLVKAQHFDGALMFVLVGMFWRSRFKYGLRGYRFTLLEAGHVAQNLLLAAAALGLASFPIGGFYDRRLDELLGVDGVNEATLYLVATGRLA